MRLGSLLVVAALAWTTRASAQTPADDAAARVLEDATHLLADADDPRAARELFWKAYELEPSWRALNGIGLAYEQESRWVEALDTYARLLDEFGGQLTTTQKSTVQRRMAALREKVVTIHFETKQPNVVVRLDGEVIGKGPLDVRRYAPPGRHVVTADLDGHVAMEREIEGAAGAVHDVAIALVPEPSADPQPTQTPRTEVPNPRPVAAESSSAAGTAHPNAASWVVPTLLAGGSAAIVPGSVLLRSAARDFDSFDRRVERESGTNLEPVSVEASTRDRAKKKRFAGYTLLGAGAGVAISGLAVRVFSTPKSSEGRNVSLRIGPQGGSVRGTF